MARASDPIKARHVATAIVQRLRNAGHTAYFAGGCVRDALLGLRPTDFDVATDATPSRVTELFDRTAEVGAAFGVVLVHGGVGRGAEREQITVEVATFRSDGPYTDARRPDVVSFSDPKSDAARRDFTINALFLDPLVESDAVTTPAEQAVQGRIIDYVGGVADLAAKVLRAVGDPDKRLAEDHLRALRAVRFAARLGFEIEPATAAAITRHAAELRGVSRERIGDEVRRILTHASRARAAGLLQDLGLDAPLLNETARRADTTILQGLNDPDLPPMLGLAAWTLDRAGAGPTGLGDEDISLHSTRLRRALCLSNEESNDLESLLRGHQYLVRAWDQAAIARRKRWAAASWFGGATRLLGVIDPAASRGILNSVRVLSGDGIGLAPTPLITGDDLVSAGLPPGPAFRRVLESVYDAQLEGRIRGRQEALELARRLYV
jgi:tRNA nucleotidyltransferase/poly(A) polymerase